MLSDHVHAVYTTGASTLPSGIITFIPLFLLILSIITTFFVSNDAWEQCANAIWGATVTLSVHDVLARLNSCGLNVIKRSDILRHPILMYTHPIQTSKIGEMQFLILLNWFKREEGENTLPLGVLIDDNVLHPAIRCTAMVLGGC